MLFSLILFSCHKSIPVILPELSRAESLVFEYPDSALAILDSMQTPSPSDPFQYATWCLLHTQAQDKSYIKQTSDSLINIAYAYFMNQKDLKRKATTLYYKGRVADDMHKGEEATIYYLQAKELAKEIQDYKLAELICANLGMVYAYRNLGDLATIEVKDAYNYSLLANDSSIISYTLSYMARVSGLFEKWDSCIYYYNQAIKIAEQSNKSRPLSMALSEIAYAYEELNQYNQAINSLKKSEHIDIREGYKGVYQTYLGLGRTYMEIGKFDSAAYYLNESLKAESIYTITSAYQNLAQLYEKQKQYKQAIRYISLYQHYSDSLKNISQTKEIVELQAKYKQEVLVNEKKQLKLEKYNLVRVALLILLTMICVICMIMIFYHHHLKRRERFIQTENNKIYNYTVQLAENKEIIQRNNQLIQSMSAQLEKSQDLKECIHEQKKELAQIYEYNDYLQTQNTHLLATIKHHSQLVQEKEKSMHTYKKLKEQNVILKEKEKLLSEYMADQLELFKQLKETPKYIQDEQWPAILKTVNVLYRNFTVRLHKEFPALTDSDLQICCLIKLKFTTSFIATLTGVSPASATKRKQRIKERMNQQHPGLWNEDISLETYIWAY